MKTAQVFYAWADELVDDDGSIKLVSSSVPQEVRAKIGTTDEIIEAVQPVQSQASEDTFSRLGLRRGQAVRVLGRADYEVVQGIPAYTGRGLAADGEIADVTLYWPADADSMPSELARVAATLQPGNSVWAIVRRPSQDHCAGPVIPQRDLLDAGQRAGLVDNRVAFLSTCEYGYRFTCCEYQD